MSGAAMADGRLSRGQYATGTLLWLILMGGAVFILIDGWSTFSHAVTRAQVLVRFQKGILFLPGGLLSLVSLIVIGVAGASGWSMPTSLRRATQWSFVVSVALGLATWLLGGMALEGWVGSRGYEACEAKTDRSLMSTEKAWVLHPTLCATDIFPETMTLRELKEALRALPPPAPPEPVHSPVPPVSSK